MAAYYGKSCVFDPRFLARKAKLDSINSISQNPHGWSSILRKFSVDPCFPLKLVIFYYTLVLFLLLTGTFEQLKTFASLELNFSGKRTYISNNGGFHVLKSSLVTFSFQPKTMTLNVQGAKQEPVRRMIYTFIPKSKTIPDNQVFNSEV